MVLRLTRFPGGAAPAHIAAPLLEQRELPTRQAAGARSGGGAIQTRPWTVVVSIQEGTDIARLRRAIRTIVDVELHGGAGLALWGLRRSVAEFSQSPYGGPYGQF